MHPGPCRRLLGDGSVGRSCRWRPRSSPSLGWWYHSSAPSPGSLGFSHSPDGCSSPPVGEIHTRLSMWGGRGEIVPKLPCCFKRQLLSNGGNVFWLSIGKDFCSICICAGKIKTSSQVDVVQYINCDMSNACILLVEVCLFYVNVDCTVDWYSMELQ